MQGAQGEHHSAENRLCGVLLLADSGKAEPDQRVFLVYFRLAADTKHIADGGCCKLDGRRYCRADDIRAGFRITGVPFAGKTSDSSLLVFK